MSSCLLKDSPHQSDKAAVSKHSGDPLPHAVPLPQATPPPLSFDLCLVQPFVETPVDTRVGLDPGDGRGAGQAKPEELFIYTTAPNRPLLGTQMKARDVKLKKKNGGDISWSISVIGRLTLVRRTRQCSTPSSRLISWSQTVWAGARFSWSHALPSGVTSTPARCTSIEDVSTPEEDDISDNKAFQTGLEVKCVKGHVCKSCSSNCFTVKLLVEQPVKV